MRLLVVAAPYYKKISADLQSGAEAAIAANKVQADFIEVKGALEIAPAIKRLSASGLFGRGEWDGFVALGCVIRGETSHYDIVANLSAQGLMELGVRDGLAIGNGILTTENEAQALVRADPKQGNKGGFAVEACLTLVRLKR